MIHYQVNWKNFILMEIFPKIIWVRIGNINRFNSCPACWWFTFHITSFGIAHRCILRKVHSLASAVRCLTCVPNEEATEILWEMYIYLYSLTHVHIIMISWNNQSMEVNERCDHHGMMKLDVAQIKSHE